MSKPPAANGKAREPLEVWAALAYVVGALFLLALLYLGLRPGGRGPVLVWSVAPELLPLVAFALLLAGAIWSVRKPPFLRPGRRLPFLVLVLAVGVGAFALPYPSSHEGHESATCFRLPFEGEWTVFWGGEKKEESLLAVYTADRRWGLDLVVAKEGRTHAEGARAASDYYVFGREVLAPADGVVVRAIDEVPDGVPGEIDRRVDPPGNRIVIQVAGRQFVFLCHLAKGSIVVREGQKVKAGDLLGRVGCSGWSKFTPEPHLAIHLQDTPEDGCGEAIPWCFCGFLADGARIERGLPRGGIGPGGALLGQKIAPQSR